MKTWRLVLTTIMLMAGAAVAQNGDWFVSTNGNDTWAGTNWTTAFATISNGVAHATNGQTVLVGTGTYSVAQQINVTTNLTLLGVGGASNTIVTRGPDTTNRIFSLAHSGAIVDGFTITNGLWDTGAGAYLSAGTLRNCTIEKNTSYDRGGRDFGAGIYTSGGMVSNCVIRSNRGTGPYAKGGGVNLGGGLIRDCVINNNWANENGSGICLANSTAQAKNCIVRGNTGNNAVFFYASGGQVVNCTVSSNPAWGIVIENPSTGGTVSNTISYFNTSGDVQAAYTSRYSYCCAPGLTFGGGNITNDPKFVNLAGGDLHLAADSPCIDAGINRIWTPTDIDLAGNLRIQHGFVDMGAYETPGSFGCNFVSAPTTGFAPLTNVFTAYVSGTNQENLFYNWDVNADGVIDQSGGDKRVITNVYTLPGLYSVALNVSNTTGNADTFTNRNYIYVTLPTMYVSPSGSNTFPYATWESAATTIQSAVTYGADGTTILITNGTYTLGNTITLSLGMTLRSVNGPGTTVINGNAAYRCFTLNSAGAMLDGLTISNGYSTFDGGGFTMNVGTAQNCVVRNNMASRYGGGIYMGNGTLKNCLITGNASLGNSAPLASAGGGLYMNAGTVLHCTIAGNTAVRGGANAGDGMVMNGGTVSNTIVYDNSLFPYPETQRNVYKTGGTFAYSCTIPAIAGTSNTIADPQFTDRWAGNYRLLPGSPCIDKGAGTVGLATDLLGTARPLDGDAVAGAVVDMGAYEAEALNAGPLRCNFIVSTNIMPGALTNIVFLAQVAGADTSIAAYRWDFTGDGSDDLIGSSFSTVTNPYSAGFYSVRLTVSNSTSQSSTLLKPACVRVPSPLIYVSPSGSAELPYDTWAKAATNLNAAVEAAFTVGCTQQVFVTNGQYALDRELNLNRPIVLTSINGANNTIASRSGTYFHRIASLTHSAAIMDGFTITNGYENTDAYGGGVSMSAGLLQNCLVTKNTDIEPSSSRPYGGGIHASGGLILNCTISRNSSSGSYGKAGGLNVVNATVQRCIIEGNYAQEGYGGGILLQGASRVENCLIRNNNATAVFFMQANKALMRNCTVVENTGGSALTIWADSTSCTGLNCIAFYNTSPDTQNNSGSSVIQYSCAPELSSGLGNITAPPLFVDRPAGNFRLMPNSPCMDTGLTQGWTSRDRDLDNKRRVVNVTVDMGAYEIAKFGTLFVAH